MKHVIDRRRHILGQHFLSDEKILRKIIDYADLSERDTVLEIGPGKGELTSLIAEKANKIIAVEKDRGLYIKLKNRPSRKNNIRLIYGDVLKTKIPAFNKVISNIPYSISRKFIIWLLKRKFSSAILLLQEEFADKLTSQPKDKNYSWISVITQSIAQVDLLELVPRYYFTPSPKVDSRIVRIRLKNRYKLLENNFIDFSSSLFSFKNKTLRNALRHLQKKDRDGEYMPFHRSIKLEDLPFEKRVNQLTVKEVENLYERLI